MNKETKGISRRDFLKTGAMAGGVLSMNSLAGYGTISSGAAIDEVNSNADTWDLETDVLVVGFGAAGGAAALEAHDAGAEVLILEKTATPGGALCLCAGIYYGAGTSLQKAAGINDTADDMYNYLELMACGMGDSELRRVMSDRSADTFEWLVNLGTEFYEGVNIYGGIPIIKPLDNDDTSFGLYCSGGEFDPIPNTLSPTVPRGHICKPVEPTWPYPPIHPTAPTEIGPARGSGYFKSLWEGAKSRGIKVLLETRAMKLITDPKTGGVIGVEALQATIPTTDLSKPTDFTNAKPLRIKARKAVILGTGGYSQNKEFQSVYCKLGYPGKNFNASDTGDGLIMGMEIGAGTTILTQIFITCSQNRGSILVNKGARRFADETLYRVGPNAWTKQMDSTAWEIGDSVMLGDRNADYKADTIEALAEQIKLDPKTLAQTVNYYNDNVAEGYDREWGKTRITQHGNMAEGGDLMAISTPPFYANLKTPETVLNESAQGQGMGGLRINTKAQVLKTYTNEAIPGLYAAGNTGGGIIGEMYPGSGSNTVQAFVWGRIAGANAASEASLE